MPAVVATTSGIPASVAAFTVTLPTHAAGNLLLLFVGGKYDVTGTLTINNGWTSAGQYTGGTGAQAANTGPVFVAVFYKVAASSSETAPTVSPGSPVPDSWVWMARSFQPTSGRTMIAPQVRSASDTNPASPLTGTTSAWSPAVDAASTIAQAIGVVPDRNGTAQNPGGGALTVPGWTGGTVSALSTDYVETALGADCAMEWSHLSGATGTSSGGPTVTYSITGTNDDSGVVLAVAVADVAPASAVPGTAMGSFGFTAVASGTTYSVPALDRRIVGPTGLIRTTTAAARSVRLKIGTNTAVTTGVVYSSAQTPTGAGYGSGYSTHDTTGLGLTPGGTYYYRVEMSDVLGAPFLDTETTVGKFRVAPTGPTSFSFSFGSCTDFTYLTGGNTDSLALAAAAAQPDDLFFHLGDLYYGDGTSPTEANFRTFMASRLDAPAHADIFSTRASNYTPSDHDFGFANDSTGVGDPTASANFNAVYREVWPAPVPSSGVYYAFTWGRVRFIQLDGRTFKSAPGSADGAGKRVLGTTQEAWFLNEIDTATEPLIIVAQDIPVIGPAETSDDGWMGYTTNRATIAAAIAASGKNVVFLAGDAHSAYFDDGTSADGMGVPVLGGSPFLTTASRKGGPFTVGPEPAAGTAVTQQYGRVEITDDGTQITLDFEALSSSNVVLLSGALEFGPVSGTASASLGFTAAAAGVVRKAGSALAALGFTGLASGHPRVLGSAAASLGFTATAAGTIGDPPVAGAASAALGFTAAATGVRRALGSAAAALGFTASATAGTESPEPPDHADLVIRNAAPPLIVRDATPALTVRNAP